MARRGRDGDDALEDDAATEPVERDVGLGRIGYAGAVRARSAAHGDCRRSRGLHQAQRSLDEQGTPWVDVFSSRAVAVAAKACLARGRRRSREQVDPPPGAREATSMSDRGDRGDADIRHDPPRPLLGSHGLVERRSRPSSLRKFGGTVRWTWAGSNSPSSCTDSAVSCETTHAPGSRAYHRTRSSARTGRPLRKTVDPPVDAQPVASLAGGSACAG